MSSGRGNAPITNGEAVDSHANSNALSARSSKSTRASEAVPIPHWNPTSGTNSTSATDIRSLIVKLPVKTLIITLPVHYRSPPPSPVSYESMVVALPIKIDPASLMTASSKVCTLTGEDGEPDSEYAPSDTLKRRAAELLSSRRSTRSRKSSAVGYASTAGT